MKAELNEQQYDLLCDAIDTIEQLGIAWSNYDNGYQILTKFGLKCDDTVADLLDNIIRYNNNLAEYIMLYATVTKDK